MILVDWSLRWYARTGSSTRNSSAEERRAQSGERVGGHGQRNGTEWPEMGQLTAARLADLWEGGPLAGLMRVGLAVEVVVSIEGLWVVEGAVGR